MLLIIISFKSSYFHILLLQNMKGCFLPDPISIVQFFIIRFIQINPYSFFALNLAKTVRSQHCSLSKAKPSTITQLTEGRHEMEFSYPILFSPFLFYFYVNKLTASLSNTHSVNTIIGWISRLLQNLKFLSVGIYTLLSLSKDSISFSNISILIKLSSATSEILFRIKASSFWPEFHVTYLYWDEGLSILWWRGKLHPLDVLPISPHLL